MVTKQTRRTFLIFVIFQCSQCLTRGAKLTCEGFDQSVVLHSDITGHHYNSLEVYSHPVADGVRSFTVVSGLRQNIPEKSFYATDIMSRTYRIDGDTVVMQNQTTLLRGAYISEYKAVGAVSETGALALGVYCAGGEKCFSEGVNVLQEEVYVAYFSSAGGTTTAVNLTSQVDRADMRVAYRAPTTSVPFGVPVRITPLRGPKLGEFLVLGSLGAGGDVTQLPVDFARNMRDAAVVGSADSIACLAAPVHCIGPLAFGNVLSARLTLNAPWQVEVLVLSLDNDCTAPRNFGRTEFNSLQVLPLPDGTLAVVWVALEGWFAVQRFSSVGVPLGAQIYLKLSAGRDLNPRQVDVVEVNGALFYISTWKPEPMLKSLTQRDAKDAHTPYAQLHDADGVAQGDAILLTDGTFSMGYIRIAQGDGGLWVVHTAFQKQSGVQDLRATRCSITGVQAENHPTAAPEPDTHSVPLGEDIEGTQDMVEGGCVWAYLVVDVSVRLLCLFTLAFSAYKVRAGRRAVYSSTVASLRRPALSSATNATNATKERTTAASSSATGGKERFLHSHSHAAANSNSNSNSNPASDTTIITEPPPWVQEGAAEVL